MIEIADFGELVGDGVALLGQATVSLPIRPELASDPMPSLREEVAVRLVRRLIGRSVWVFLTILERPELTEQHIERRLVLRVIFEDSALQVLHRVGFAVQVATL